MCNEEPKMLDIRAPQGSFILYPSMSKEESLEAFNEWFKNTYGDDSPLDFSLERVVEKYVPTKTKSKGIDVQEWCDKLNKIVGFEWARPRSKYMTAEESEAREFFEKEMDRLGLIYSFPLTPNECFKKDDEQLKTENMDNRFPFKLKEKDAKRIVNAACDTWKKKLSREKEWGSDLRIVTGKL